MMDAEKVLGQRSKGRRLGFIYESYQQPERETERRDGNGIVLFGRGFVPLYVHDKESGSVAISCTAWYQLQFT